MKFSNEMQERIFPQYDYVGFHKQLVARGLQPQDVSKLLLTVETQLSQSSQMPFSSPYQVVNNKIQSWLDIILQATNRSIICEKEEFGFDFDYIRDSDNNFVSKTQTEMEALKLKELDHVLKSFSETQDQSILAQELLKG